MAWHAAQADKFLLQPRPVRSRHACIERCGIKAPAVAVLDVAHSIDAMDTYAVYICLYYICQCFCKRLVSDVDFLAIV